MAKNQMSIKEFVKTALEEIHAGMEGKKIKDFSVPISFEIGVEVSQNRGKETAGGLGLSVASVLSLGAKGKSNSNDESKAFNKLSFTIPLYLDQDKIEVMSWLAKKKGETPSDF